MSVERARIVPGNRKSMADVLALAFGVTVAMWAAAYVGRLPGVVAPSAVLIGIFGICLVAGGMLAGRITERGWRGGAVVGLLSGLINLLVLGSLLGGTPPNRVVPSAVWWVPGFLASSAALGALGALAALAGRRGVSRSPGPRAWVAIFAWVAVTGTLLLLAVGGLVTSKGVGLAVVDWPNSYGYNMFLFPLSRMTGGIYYEHAHRLFGALVGLCTVVLAILVQRIDDRTWMRRLGWTAVAMVILQGILGGLRVTGRFTLESTRVEPNITLAVVHGVLAQLFLATLVSIAVCSSRGWRAAVKAPSRGSSGIDRVLGVVVVLSLIVQIVLGAIQRHLDRGLVFHVVMAAWVAVVALPYGTRAWVLNRSVAPVRYLGHVVVDGTILQIVLGLASYLATRAIASPRFEVGVVTLHQWCGAALLASTVALTLWTFRITREAVYSPDRLPAGIGKRASS